MSAPLLLILIAALAFLATHVLYEWLAKRLLIVSGAEYLVLGVLLGPQVTGLFPPSAVAAFEPILVLAIGWMGILAGTSLRLPRLVRIPSVAYRLSLVESLTTFALVAAGATSALAYSFQMTYAGVALPALTLGAIAVASTPAGLDVAYGLSARVGARRAAPVLRQIEVAHGMDAFVSIFAFGILIAAAHTQVPLMMRALTTTEWVVVTLGIGVVGGALFHLFLGSERSPDRLFISLGGAVILTSGAASYLQLSPTLAAFVMGIVLANSLRQPAPVSDVLRAGERPLYYVSLMLAGAAWSSGSNVAWWLVIMHYVVLRTIAKLWGTGIVTWINRAQGDVGLDWGRALMGQGRLTFVLALDYSRRGLLYGDLVFTCAAVSVLFTEFFAARFVRSAVDPLLVPLEQLSLTLSATTDAVMESVTETMANRFPALRKGEPDGESPEREHDHEEKR